jgi:hypothetical protein
VLLITHTPRSLQTSPEAATGHVEAQFGPVRVTTHVAHVGGAYPSPQLHVAVPPAPASHQSSRPPQRPGHSTEQSAVP